MIQTLAHLFILCVLPPLLLGVIGKAKAFFAGRRGPPLLQTYRDIAKLLRKGLVLSGTTTWVFLAGPIVTLVAVALAGLFVPFGAFASPLSFSGDMVLFAYLFALSRFFTTAAALDTGSAFEGMGSAREATFACLSEPALFFVFLALAKQTLSLSLTSMLGASSGSLLAASSSPLAVMAPLVLVCLGLFIIILAETCRIPVDDPATHLELTMIHEAMVLDHGGPLLGLIEYAGAMKLFVLESLFLSLVLPFKTNIALLDWGIFVAEELALAAAIGVVESVMARLRMRRVPYLLTGALLLCGSGFILLVR
jgi:formate hydrogenlyase subunit 4